MTEADKPVIETLFDNVQLSLAKRPNMVIIPSRHGDIDGTYQRLLGELEAGVQASNS